MGWMPKSVSKDLSSLRQPLTQRKKEGSVCVGGVLAGKEEAGREKEG